MQMQNLTEIVRSKDILLKIEGHSVTMAMSDGEAIKSKKWSVGGHDWEIHWRPKNHWAGRHRPVTLDLVLVSEPRGGGVRAKLSCRLVDPAGGRLAPPPSKEKTISHKFFKPGDYSGGLVVTTSQDLEASGYLADDAYTMQCTITVLREAPAAAAAAAAVDRDDGAALPSADLHRHLGELLRSWTGADVTFQLASSGEEFAAHRAVLASRSPVFMAELFGGMNEEVSRRVVVKDMAPAFQALLRFVYTDTAPDVLLGDDGDGAATAMAQHLLAGADRYGLDRLKLICEGRLADSITVGTAATTLALAEQHRCSQLKASCVEFIAGYLDAVLETEGYKHLEASCPWLLTEILKATRRPTN